MEEIKEVPRFMTNKYQWFIGIIALSWIVMIAIYGIWSQQQQSNNMKKLINISNHPSTGWSDAQKAGWDQIIDIPFPQVPATATKDQLNQYPKMLL